MIRVLHIITRLDVGGSTENTVISATRMPPSEFRCGLISGRSSDPPPGLADHLAAAGVAWTTLPSLQRPVRPLADLSALSQLWRAIRTLRPDIVHTHSSKAGFLGRVAARLARTPHIVHTPHGHVFVEYFSGPVTRIFIRMERLTARWTDRIITLSDEEARDHVRQGIGRLGQFVTIPSGVDLEPVRAALPVRPASEGPLIGAVGRLAPIKGFHHLVEAAPHILRAAPTARLVIVGDGEMRPELEAQARRNGLGDRILFMGFREDVPSLIAGMDVVVLPSLNEGMGRVLVMAMARGKPIVASRVGGVPELLGEGEAGLLVPPADPAALAGAITTLLHDPARARELGEAGRRRAPRYSAEAMIESLAALYREVMSHGAS